MYLWQSRRAKASIPYPLAHGIRVPECPRVHLHRLPACILCHFHALVEQRGLAFTGRRLDQEGGSLLRIVPRKLQTFLEIGQNSLPSVKVLRLLPVFYVGGYAT